MAQAKNGDKVTVHYTGRLAGGEVFDSSECHEDDCGCESGPMKFVIGEGEVIPGFEQAVIGMSPGEEKTVVIPVDQAYGERVDEMVAVVNRSEIPPDLTLEVGGQLEVTQEDGQVFPVLITEVTDSTVTLDANHPLAGQELTFDLKLVEIG
ncbi:MAG TPA: peptidylprolyl isomerase [Geobacteraceae bacterium]